LKLLLAFLFLSVSLHASAGFSFFKKNNIDEISVVSKELDYAKKIDIVFIKGSAVKSIKGMSPENWFKNKNFFLTSFPEEIAVSAIEIPPHYFINTIDLPRKSYRYTSVLLFVSSVNDNSAIDLTKNCEPLIKVFSQKVIIAEQDLSCE
jgi:hypothetical protein